MEGEKIRGNEQQENQVKGDTFTGKSARQDGNTRLANP